MTQVFKRANGSICYSSAYTRPTEFLHKETSLCPEIQKMVEDTNENQQLFLESLTWYVS